MMWRQLCRKNISRRKLLGTSFSAGKKQAGMRASAAAGKRGGLKGFSLSGGPAFLFGYRKQTSALVFVFIVQMFALY